MKITDFLIPTYSYVSIIELGNYLAGKSDEDPYENPHIKPRLYPELPQSEYICFYPMDKRRNETYNWYMLPLEERQEQCTITVKSVVNMLVKSNNLSQALWALMISNGVSRYLQMTHFNLKIVSEMRFDETTARYGDFGSFYVGNIITKDSLPTLLKYNLSLYFN